MIFVEKVKYGDNILLHALKSIIGAIKISQTVMGHSSFSFYNTGTLLW